MRTILITGGNGFIGSNLVDCLLNDNLEYNIIVFDKLDHPQNLGDNENIKYYKADVRNKYDLNRVLSSEKNIDGVIHLSAVSRVVWGEENPVLCNETNILGTQNLVECLNKHHPNSWIIFGSSREVYGEAEKLPVKESYDKKPINTYAISKLKGESIIKNASKIHNSVILRFSNVYGNERDILDRVIPKFILSALKNKPLTLHGDSQFFDFTYIDDTIQGIILAIKYLEEIQSNEFCEDFHLLYGAPTSLYDLVDIISDELNKECNVEITAPRDYDVEKFYGDPSKAYDYMGFRAKVNVKKGISRTINRFKEVFL